MFHRVTRINQAPPSLFTSGIDNDYNFMTYELDDDQTTWARSVREPIVEEAKPNGRKKIIAIVLSVAALLLIGGIAGAVAYATQKDKDKDCDPQCWNGGTCVSNVCQCPQGFTGSTCETVVCSPSCSHGQCLSPQTCTCQSGWSGTSCDQSICTTPCVNGNCTQPNTCTCATGYAGSTCGTPICSPSCIHGTCSSPNNCTCQSTWSGSICNSPVCSPVCQNGGTCTAPSTCQCPANYTGSICTTPVCTSTCLNGGTCSAPNTCTCTSSWTGATCATPVCSPSCINSGSCIAPNNCSCTANTWTGSICQTPICTNACLNGGNCSSPQTCTCTSQYNGSTCATPICTSACLNGGNCTAPNTCTCATGYNGSVCQNPICSPSCVNGTCTSPNTCTCNSGWNGTVCNIPVCSPSCQNNGNCTAPGVCTCPSTYSGSYCQNPVCSPACQNGGTCTAPSTCQCPANYTGSICTTPVCTSTCLNGGTCSAPNTCTCTSSWTGATCATPVCSPSCLNSGSCIAPNNCSCTANTWTGSICQTPICTNACLNGGNCSSPQTCTCTSQYNGSTCATPICTSACLNGGNCTAPNTCTCATGYNGSVCQYPVCNPSCLNGGTCSAPNTCQCIADVWTGPVCQTPIRIMWAFDNSYQDLYGNYQGVSVNSPSFVSPGITGYGTCLYLNRSLSQSVTIYSPPFLNMAYTSFSLVAWVKATSFSNGAADDNAIFGQFDQNTLDRSLHIIVRSQLIYLGFYADDIQGSRTLYPGNWYHMAYVYDYSTLTQYVYVNGVLDVSGSPKGPYQGIVGNLTIGTNGVRYPNNYWDGCIDQVTYAARAKNASEVLREATLSVALTFDNNLIDAGPLGINGSGTSFTYSTSGRVNRSLSLLTNPSYVQTTGLVLLGTSNQAYSLAIWIKPTVITSGTIIHVSALTTGLGWCIPMLGFTSAGRIGAHSWNSGSISITGPAAVANVWTHLVLTYGTSNGIRLYINGTQYGSASGAFNYLAASAPVTATLGSPLSGTGCATGPITAGQYSGYMDEFQVYSRELNSTEVLALANP